MDYSLEKVSFAPEELKLEYDTAREIAGQPILWQDTYRVFVSEKENLKDFLQKVLTLPGVEIILTGAGTSAFIGDTLQGIFQKHCKRTTRSIPTTDLVTHPELYISPTKPLLLISFARSGNSPESIKAIGVAEQINPDIHHLIITCNGNGELATIENTIGHKFVFILPPDADDKSLAMTGSFSSMLLAGILVAWMFDRHDSAEQIGYLIEAGTRLLNKFVTKIKEIAQLDFDRAVFLGSGPMLGIARESHLKLQELSDGRVICKHDSFLGFRHGPKAVISSRTLMVYLFSESPYVHLYERDLVQAVNEGERGMYSIGVAAMPKPDIDVNLEIVIAEGENRPDDDFLPVCYILPAQLIGLFKSLNLGFSPDSPSQSGTITRVVQGVNIYPYKNKSVNRNLKGDRVE